MYWTTFSVCVCGTRVWWVSVSPNASQGDLAFLLQGFPFNSFWDWNYDEVIFLQKLPMSLVVSLGKFLKCIFNLSLSLVSSLHLSSLPLWLSFSELSLDMSMCQCHITRKQYTRNNLVHNRKKKRKRRNLFIFHQQNSLSLKYTVMLTYLYILYI